MTLQGAEYRSFLINYEDEIAQVCRDESQRVYGELIKGLKGYAEMVHGEKPWIPLGTRLLEPGDGIPMAWKFVTYLEQLGGGA